MNGSSTAPQASSRARLDITWAWIEQPDAGRSFAVAEVARLHGVATSAARLVHVCPECGSSQHGRPVVVWRDGAGPDVHISLSRSGDFVLVGVTDAGPVGVDVERAGDADFAGFEESVLHEDEDRGQDRTVTWVRKESVLKACGRGLEVDPRSLQISTPRAAPQVLQWSRPERPEGRAWMFDLDLPQGLVGSATVLADLPPIMAMSGQAR